MKYTIEITYDQLLLLDGKVDEKAQNVIESAKIDHVNMDIGDELLSAILGNAIRRGTLEISWRKLSECGHCNKKATYKTYKSGRNRGQKNYDKKNYLWGVAFQDGFITFEGHSKFSFCDTCGQAAIEKLKTFILERSLPIELKRDGDSKYIKENARTCFKCERKMWEFDMGLRPAIMSGYYHSACPHCGAESLPFGNSHKHLDEFRMVEKSTLTKHSDQPYCRPKETPCSTSH